MATPTSDAPPPNLLMIGGGTGWLEPGFTNDSVTSYLFKKSLQRTNTSLDLPYYRERFVRPNVYRDYVASDKVPNHPPTDFVTLTNEQIKEQFGVNDAEIAGFATMLNGTNVFSIERSTSYPHLYKINYLRLTPHPLNPAGSFRSVTSTTNVNILQYSIPFTHGSQNGVVGRNGNGNGNGSYRGAFYRTDGAGNLSKDGLDIVLSQQVSFVYDFDEGLFNLHESDDKPYTTNPVSVTKPPAISCYVYRGAFGRFGWSYLAPDSLVLDEMRLWSAGAI